ncbi:MAG: hypothetical protein WC775_04855 [Patescibacteria group bacterium]|jgi:hypothetical protein
MNYTPLPQYLINSLEHAQQPGHQNNGVGIATKAMVGVLLTLFVVLGSFTFLLFQGPKTNSRASDLPPTPQFRIPTTFVVPTDVPTPEVTTPSGTFQQ